VTEVPYVRHPAEFPARHAHGPDSLPKPGVPRGAIHEYEWNVSRVFPGTHRRYWPWLEATISCPRRLRRSTPGTRLGKHELLGKRELRVRNDLTHEQRQVADQRGERARECPRSPNVAVTSAARRSRASGATTSNSDSELIT
jgi:hypothetical protein